MGSEKSDPAVRKLRDEADKLRAKGRHEKALEIYERLCRMESDSARWPHMAGEVCQRMGRIPEAVAHFGRACERYSEKGMDVKALALARVILGLDPHNAGARAILGAPPAAPKSRLDRLAGLTPAEKGSRRAPRELELDTNGHGASGGWAGPADASSASGVYSLPGAGDDMGPIERLDGPNVPPEGRAAGTAARQGPSRPPPVPISLKPGETLDGLQLREVVGSAEVDIPARVASGASRRSASVEEMDRASREFQRVKTGEDEEEETSVVRAVNASEVALEDDRDSMLNQLFPSEPAAAPARAAPPPVPKDARRPSPGVRPRPGIGSVAVPSTPLFGELEPGALGHLVARMEERSYAKGQVLVRQGDPGGALYVVVEGVAGVFKEGQPRVRVGEIREGGFFGEISIVTNAPRQATVIAEAEMRVLEISKEVVVELLQEHPEVVSVLMKFFRRRMVESLLKTSPLFTNVDNATRRKLAGHFKFLETDPGLRFIKQGRPTPGLFVLMSGEARVVTADGGNERFLARLGPGDVVGESSLFSGRPATVSVEAVTKCWMVYMAAKDFRKAASVAPEMVTYLMNLTDKRRRAVLADRRAGVEFPVERLPVW